MFCFCLSSNNLKNQRNHLKSQFQNRAHFLPKLSLRRNHHREQRSELAVQSGRWRQKGWNAQGGSENIGRTPGKSDA
jgi:hypothetical protein